MPSCLPGSCASQRRPARPPGSRRCRKPGGCMWCARLQLTAAKYMPLSFLRKTWEMHHPTRQVQVGVRAAAGSSGVTRLILRQAFQAFFIFVFVNINFFSEEKPPMDHPMLAKAVSSPAFPGWIDLGHQIGLGGLQLAVAPRLWQSFRSPFGRQVKVPSAGLPSRTEKRMHRNLWPRTSGPEHVPQMQCVMFTFLLCNI